MPNQSSSLPSRMYPVVIGNGRNLQSDAIISGYHVPKGVRKPMSTPQQLCCLIITFVFQTHVIFPHLVVSNLEEYFPEPQRFLPERWIKRGEMSKLFIKIDWPKQIQSGRNQKTNRFPFLLFFLGRRYNQLPLCWPKDPSIRNATIWLWPTNVYWTTIR